ncbi:VWA domain-containing protein [Gallaecimonas mangrovi]|uniref:VWA domain-containing protein n=1 Tax=Gallaecimonas mangrovi TaxID=2291597 RepID=UPI0018680268|nr:VWA domain-containing protein [Gallaecimonas mangrovi]
MILLRPYWLLALIPLAVLLWWCWQRRPAGSGWQKLLPPHLAKHLLTGQDGAQSRWPLLLLALGWLIATLALAGPSWRQDKYPLYQLSGGRVIVMDMSMTMRATDLTPDRLTQSKFKAIDLVRALKEGETGLVAYAGDAFTISPLTKDASTLEHLIHALSSEIMPVQGQRADLGIKKAMALLTHAGFKRGNILLFTDGFTKQEQSAISNLDLGEFKVSALVFGTPQGAPIKTMSGGLLKGDNGQVVIPQTHMSDVCSAVNGLCIKAGLDDGDIKALLTKPKGKEDKSDEVISLPQDGGRYLLWLLVPLLLLAFRRGLLVAALGVTLVQMAPQAHADAFKNRSQEGYQQYQKKDFKAAANTFNDPDWRAAALYRAGQYKAAAKLWATQKGAKARYNEGNALAKAGQLDDALKAYDKALKEKPDFKDARFNRDLVKKQQAQHKNKQGSDQNKNKDGKNQNKDQQGNSQNNKGNQGKKPGDQSPKSKDNKGQNKGKKPGDKGKQKDQQPQDNKAQQNPNNAQNPQQNQDKKQQSQQGANSQQPKDKQQAEPQKAQAEGDKDTKKGQQQAAKALPKDGKGPATQTEADKILDSVNDDPGYLLQQQMRRAYEARKRNAKEDQPW